ncbi:DNA helicase/exodeoxyribonuclease V, alpha subunit [Microlunatus sagamiharensis]|uniref:RecBCD enzyme subunit RecD n=1 Tax=Microlunatus sagamiharensis TaxID=546874 RepID=A0A1H2MC11_9ACTN|nr:exodeoxyribonuclease V subunit alpha [Microlunatus sagamiharensis]SDU90719.1 DNA helicase/exodeoxyribonuclease V, alpha subunit [Microlunatus sagamiharensis]
MSAASLELSAVRVRSALLERFHTAGVLGLADVHTAEALGRMVRERDERVLLAAALTVRALRNGSVCLDLTTASDVALAEDEAVPAGGVATDPALGLEALEWPEPAGWLEACRESPLVAGADAPPAERPLRLAGTLLYLERYWQQEESVRTQLEARTQGSPPGVDDAALFRDLDRLFPPSAALHGEPDHQREAAESSARRRVTVLAGGPGTGKTTTVARLLALLNAQPGPAPRVALAAPTGKAAARLAEAVREAAARLPEQDRARLGALDASTVHRLLGWRPGSKSRFRHDAANPLPHDVVVVDEMSMVSLTLMARLLEAVRPDARLVLVGDPDQLSSVEAGAVLADITGTANASVVRLTHNWRFEGTIAQLADAVRTGDADRAVALLTSGATDVTLAPLDAGAGLGAGAPGLDELAQRLSASADDARRAAAAGDAAAALRAVEAHRLLCAHRRGPYGVNRWNLEVEQWLARTLPGYAADGEFYLGRPLLVTANDKDLDLWNGDTGVVTRTDAGLRAAFARAERPLLYPPARLDAVSTVHAMTVHKAQGSQFAAVTLVLPPPESPLLTRELLYTAVSRATTRVLLLGSEDAVRQAVSRPANRASGLRQRMG